MTLQARTRGLALEVEDGLRGALALGILEADGLRLEALPPAFDAECDRVVEQILGARGGRSAADVPGVAETRALFHRLDLDPTKTRPSSEALLRRVLQGKGLPQIQPAVDVCNLASLEHQLPVGLYDRANVKGAIYARIGRPGEGYEGIRKGRVNLAGRPLLADDEGAFGAPTADSARTQVSDSTRAVLAVIYCPAERPNQQLSLMLARVADLIARHCGATVHLVQTRQ